MIWIIVGLIVLLCLCVALGQDNTEYTLVIEKRNNNITDIYLEEI